MTGLDAPLRGLLSRPRYEVIPAKAAEQAVLDHVPAGMTVTVTASPVKGLEPTVELAERLAARGYRVVPHLAARSVESQQVVDNALSLNNPARLAVSFVKGTVPRRSTQWRKPGVLGAHAGICVGGDQ